MFPGATLVSIVSPFSLRFPDVSPHLRPRPAAESPAAAFPLPQERDYVSRPLSPLSQFVNSAAPGGGPSLAFRLHCDLSFTAERNAIIARRQCDTIATKIRTPAGPRFKSLSHNQYRRHLAARKGSCYSRIMPEWKKERVGLRNETIHGKAIPGGIRPLFLWPCSYVNTNRRSD